ncbi:MAG: DUF3164 family protein [Sulfurospirillaceae bacterium]|nr:DUF3164 family protein [Sulfurospirillaceae bacterium]
MILRDDKGFWINGKGEAVHPDMIRVDEQLKSELVERIIAAAQNLTGLISIFKAECNEQVESYFALLLQNYNVDAKGKSVKGNLNLENFSSTAKVEIRSMDTLKPDEKIQIAKMKLDEFLKEETEDSTPIVRTLIMKAFEVDKKGNIDTKKLLALRSYDIVAPKWVEAMSIIADSLQVASTKSYIRFYTRENSDSEWSLIPIDIAAV